MDKTTNNSFCIQPFINITTRIRGNHNVCCNIQTEDSNIQNISASAVSSIDNLMGKIQDIYNKHLKDDIHDRW